MSDLNEIQSDDTKAKGPIVQNQDSDVEAAEVEEVVPEGMVNPKEYDYLLTMPLWSLSDEKIEELNR